MAWLSPPRHAVHRGLRIPDLRKGDDSPSGPGCTALFAKPAVPQGYKSRGSSVTTRAPHPKLDRDYAPTADLRSRQTSTKMSMLLRHESELYKAEPLVTQ